MCIVLFSLTACGIKNENTSAAYKDPSVEVQTETIVETEPKEESISEKVTETEPEEVTETEIVTEAEDFRLKEGDLSALLGMTLKELEAEEQDPDIQKMLDENNQRLWVDTEDRIYAVSNLGNQCSINGQIPGTDYIEATKKALEDGWSHIGELVWYNKPDDNTIIMLESEIYEKDGYELVLTMDVSNTATLYSVECVDKELEKNKSDEEGFESTAFGDLVRRMQFDNADASEVTE